MPAWYSQRKNVQTARSAGPRDAAQSATFELDAPAVLKSAGALELPREAPARLGATELRRRFWHITPGFLPFLLWPIPHRDPISPTLQSIMILLIAGLGLRIFWQFRLIARDGEQGGIGAILGYTLSVLGMLLLFPADAELGLTVLAILAFGDGAATLGGLMLDGPRLPWNREKTWSGTLSFLVAGVPMASIIYWGESHNAEALQPGVSFGVALLCGGSAALAAAIAESLPSKINDNIRVGLAASAAVAAAHGLLVGWTSVG